MRFEVGSVHPLVGGRAPVANIFREEVAASNTCKCTPEEESFSSVSSRLQVREIIDKALNWVGWHSASSALHSAADHNS